MTPQPLATPLSRGAAYTALGLTALAPWLSHTFGCGCGTTSILLSLLAFLAWPLLWAATRALTRRPIFEATASLSVLALSLGLNAQPAINHMFPPPPPGAHGCGLGVMGLLFMLTGMAAAYLTCASLWVMLAANRRAR